MGLYFVIQSTFLSKVESYGRHTIAGGRARPRPLTGAGWYVYFLKNARRCRPIPWEKGVEASPAELSAICRSLQSWQRGETSEGNHLRALSARYAARIGDSDYPAAINLFIREEQRHGALLGRFLDLAGAGQVSSDWGDFLFRAARKALTSIEVWTTPVVMIETLAVVYYDAIRRATGSAVLRTICAQILADEIPHLRFQCERLANLFRRRRRPALVATTLAHRVFFLAMVLLVWTGHRRGLRAGGRTFRSYWRCAWTKMNVCWRLMDPARYDWSALDPAQDSRHDPS
jgi:hypothetical protein